MKHTNMFKDKQKVKEINSHEKIVKENDVFILKSVGWGLQGAGKSVLYLFLSEMQYHLKGYTNKSWKLNAFNVNLKQHGSIFLLWLFCSFEKFYKIFSAKLLKYKSKV